MELVFITHKKFYREYVYPKLGFLRNIHSFFYYVLFLILVGFLFFGFALAKSYFSTPFTGDYSQQGIPFAYNFYDTWWTAFYNFNFPNWDMNVFLGADSIEANTFYGLFSPFTFVTLLFPRELIPQVIAMCSIARMVIGGLFFRIYLKYLGTQETTARIFSVAYAFFGWTAYHLWFNSFYEVATFFPLILFGIEKVLREKQIWAVSLGFFLLGISNYFFFLTAGIFGVFYAGFRFFQTYKTRTNKENLAVFGLGVLGFATGILMSGVVTIPAIIASFNIARYEDSTYWSDIVNAFKLKQFDEAFNLIFLYWGGDNYGYRAFYPIASFFFPTISDRFVNIVRDQYFDNYGSSIFIFTPGIILFFASMWISTKERKISHFIAIGVLTIALFIPFFYYLCGAMSIGYGRWEIVVAISALTYVAISFDKRHMVPRAVIVVAGLLSSAIMIGSYFYAMWLDMYYTRIESYSEIVILVVYQVVLTLVTTGLLTGFWKHKKIQSVLLTILTFEITVMGTLVANIHGTTNYMYSLEGGYINVPVETKIIQEIAAKDDSFYRIQSTRAYTSNDNIMMVENYNGVSTFHSFYNVETDDFQRMSHILKGDNTWIGSGYEKRINLDAFLGVKYYILKDSDYTYSYTADGENYSVKFTPNVPLGYTRIDDDAIDDGYSVYENEHYIDFALSYDVLYYKHNCANSHYNAFHTSTNHISSTLRNEEAYFKGAILDDEDVGEISRLYPNAFSLEEAPTREMAIASVTRTYYYVEESFNPLNPDKYLESGQVISSGDISKYEASDLYIVLEPRTGDSFPMSPNGMYYIISYRITSESAATIYLIGEDENGNSKVVVYDNLHNNDSDGTKYLRAFYPTEEIKKIIICPSSEAIDLSAQLYYEDIDTTFARIDGAKEYGVSNVKQGVDYFSFDSSYDSIRYIITQIAYGEGWKIKATDENGNVYYPKTYNSQGGFVGFVTPTTGLIHYEMTYETPYVKVGVVCFVTSFVVLSGASVAIYMYNKKKKTKLMK